MFKEMFGLKSGSKKIEEPYFAFDSAVSFYVGPTHAASNQKEYEALNEEMRSVFINTLSDGEFGGMSRWLEYARVTKTSLWVHDLSTRLASDKNDLITYRLRKEKSSQERISDMYLVLSPMLVNDLINPFLQNLPEEKTLDIIRRWVMYFNLKFESLRIVEYKNNDGTTSRYLLAKGSCNEPFTFSFIREAFNNDNKSA